MNKCKFRKEMIDYNEKEFDHLLTDEHPNYYKIKMLESGEVIIFFYRKEEKKTFQPSAVITNQRVLKEDYSYIANENHLIIEEKNPFKEGYFKVLNALHLNRHMKKNSEI